MPLEFALYIALMSLGRLRVPRAATLLLAVLLMSLTKISESWEPDMLKAVYGHDLRQMAFCGAYFWGSAAFRRFRLEYLCTLSNVCLAAAIWLGLSRWPSLFATAGMVFLPFLTLAFGLATGSILGRLTNIDYSYGIYIYAFPVTQALASLRGPAPNRGGFALYLGLAFVATLALAALSWHFVEKPALRMKPKRPIELGRAA